MNVKIAAQTLSSSVADALQFLLDSKHPDFEGCEETINFIRIMDRLFDYFNTRDPFGKDFKEPIKKSNADYSKMVLSTSYDYLSKLKIEGVDILKHPRKTFVLGFLININSIGILSTKLLNELGFKYILSYKFSQDHLELLFSCIRSRGGHNNNPNVNQFRHALRKLMFRNSVQASKTSNSLEFDINHQNCILSFYGPGNATVDNNEEEEELLDHIEYDIVKQCELSYYKENILYYISGFIVKQVDKIMKCTECSDLLQDEIELPCSQFSLFLSKGKLIRASYEVFKLVKFLYNLFIALRDKKILILITAFH